MAQEIERVGIGGVDPGYTFERVNRGIHLPKISIQDAEVVPGSSAFGLPACSIQQDCAGFFGPLIVK
jgi:hypothetical protein